MTQSRNQQGLKPIPPNTHIFSPCCFIFQLDQLQDLTRSPAP